MAMLHYALTRAIVADDDEQAANLCPECEGYGSWFYDPTGARDWDTGEYLNAYAVPCEACGGTGWLTEPVTEEDTA